MPVSAIKTTAGFSSETKLLHYGVLFNSNITLTHGYVRQPSPFMLRYTCMSIN